LSVRRHGVDVAVQVSATLLTEGEQEHLGFTISLLPNSSAGPAGKAQDALPGWGRLRAQMGVTPLTQLVADAAHLAESQLIESALQAGSGRLAPASRLLMLTTDELVERIHALGLRAQGVDDGTWPPTLN
jgi:DNA-binding NtrC family response regulator